MRCVIGLAILTTTLLFPVVLRADAIVDNSLSLTGLQITPASGSVQLQSGFAASAFAEAKDSLGGFSQQFTTVDDGATSASAATTLAHANAAASVPGLTASTSGGVNIPEINAFAESTANGGPGSLIGSFEIVGTSGPVSVQLAAPLMGSQSLLTTGGGRFATSEIFFSLLLPSVSSSPLLFYDNPLRIGPNSKLNFTYSNTLTASVTLQADTPYLLIAEVDPDSSALNGTPEPSLFALTALGLCVLFVARRRRS
ncbi:MAG: PEP-CTERM sorting domain-containing protein [Acidobacteriaceae bacterium]|nr:PEP-CTERM sorting domain-containing protein [Acidobacteriaceae bacterium]MBV9296206.1 PEP-CTERM sorting domain-containing protein [Acidobacteriaceae bacterium]MBV9764304.1 PEP-CTERM sorting domain-containing protein [Acidobacteriaceae bacterium]